MEMLKKKKTNTNTSLDLVPIDDRTVKACINKMEAGERSGKNKPKSRVEPFLNIRNAISKAAGLTSVAKECDVELMFSADEVGIYVYAWHETRPKVVSSKIADEFLRRNHTSVSTSEDTPQQRAAHVGATVQACSGNTTAFYARIVDSNFPDVFRKNNSNVRKPEVFLLNKEKIFYLVACHPEVDSTTVEEYIGKLINLPAIFAEQERVIQREINGPEASQQYSSQSQPSQPQPYSSSNGRTPEGKIFWNFLNFFIT